MNLAAPLDSNGIELDPDLARVEWASALRQRDVATARLYDVARRTVRLAPETRAALLVPEKSAVERATAEARAAEAQYDAAMRAAGRTPLGSLVRI